MKILFLCVANSARSQIAEGLARHLYPKSFLIQSAGAIPSHLHPAAVAVMGEMGVDMTRQYSKGVEEIPPGSVDMVITLCTEAVCPSYLAETKECLHWVVTDPSGVYGTEEQLERFREIRDELQWRLSDLATKRGWPMRA